MTIADWLSRAEKELNGASITTARLDALVLLQDYLKKDKAWLLAHGETDFDNSLIDKQLERRIKHEPLAYIRGRSEFYGREFQVTTDTLQPRPETETLIDLLIKSSPSGALVDLGTGSGCIAITAKLECPKLEVIAIEISPNALKIAKQNATKLGADIRLVPGDMIIPVCNIITANLPYVPDSHTINQAAMQEPAIAIFGGEDGLDLYRKMFEKISELAQKPNHIFTESLPTQHEDLSKLAQQNSYDLVDTEDFIQHFRAIQ